MKKIILVLVVFAFTTGAYAQRDSTKVRTNERDFNKTQNKQNKPAIKTHPDGVMMKKGKMMRVQNGQISALDTDITLSNGTKIMKDGSFTKKDGSKTKIKEGEHLDAAGKVTRIKANKKKTMYLVPDSTKNIKR
jgi:hypothetical protein